MDEKEIDRLLDSLELYFSTLGFCALGAMMIFCGGVMLGRDFVNGLLPFIASVYGGWAMIRFGWREYKSGKRDYDEKFK